MTLEKAIDFFSGQVEKAVKDGHKISIVEAQRCDRREVLITAMDHDYSVLAAVLLDTEIDLEKLENDFGIAAMLAALNAD